jgi:hypothetical protein
MPTTVALPPSIEMAQHFNPAELDRFNNRIGFGILMLWAFIMLSIGATAHFGAQSSEYSAFEFRALS